MGEPGRYRKRGEAMQHQYKIQINNTVARANQFVYDFGHTKSITLRIKKNAAQICSSMTVAKQFEDIVGLKVKLVHDALRKVQLLHTILYGTELTVKKIIVFVDDESHTYDRKTPYFPFLFSILPKEDFDPERTWDRTELKQAVLSSPKTSANKDLRFASLYAFLGAMSKEYEIDKFSSLWTSMNAFYNYVAEQSYEISEVQPKELKQERGRIGFLLRLLGCGKEIPTRNRQDNCERDYRQVGNCLCRLSQEEIEGLCTTLASHSREQQVDFIDHRFSPINVLAQKLAITPYGLILLEYPYYLRCRYFHGDQATLLFSGYNDPEISALRVVNYILKEFLLREIPKMFQT